MTKQKSAKAQSAQSKPAKKKAGKRSGVKKPKNSLVANINRRKKAGKSRSKKASTISADAYSEMKAGWPNTTGSTKK